MTVLEKIAVASCLILGLAFQLMGSYDVGPIWLNLTVSLIVFAILLGLCGYYLFQTKYSIYQVIFGLLIMWPIGATLVLLYWPGYEVLATIESVAYPIIAVLLVRTAIMHYQENKQIRVFYILIALTLLAQFYVAIIPPYGDHGSLPQALDYVMLAGLLGLWLFRRKLTTPEYRVMTIIGIQAALFAIADVVEWLARNSILG